MFAVQLAKLLGYKVIATASPKNFDLVKSYGADEVVDVSPIALTAPLRWKSMVAMAYQRRLTLPVQGR